MQSENAMETCLSMKTTKGKTSLFTKVHCSSLMLFVVLISTRPSRVTKF